MTALGNRQNNVTEAQENYQNRESQNSFWKWLGNNDEVLTAASTFIVEAAKNCKSKKGEVLAVLTAVGTFVSAVGSLAVAWQASEIANQSKVTAVLSFQEKRIQEEPLIESFTKVNEAVLEAKKEIQNIDINDKEKYEEYKEYLIRTVEPSNQGTQKNQGIEKDVQIVFSFYRGVANCVIQEACDREAALAIFGEDVEEFNVIFAPYFCDVAMKTGDYTINQGLETFYGADKRVLDEGKCSSVTAFAP